MRTQPPQIPWTEERELERELTVTISIRLIQINLRKKTPQGMSNT
jgi:hypothetical protein